MTAAGLLVATAVGAVEFATLRRQFGASDAATLARAQSDVLAAFARTGQALTARAAALKIDPELLTRARDDFGSAGTLFTLLDSVLPQALQSTAGLSVHGADLAPLAWIGRASDWPRERLAGPRAVFVAIDARGPWLVSIEPLPDPAHPAGPRLGTLVLEERVTPDLALTPTLAERLLLRHPAVAVAIRSLPTALGARSASVFPVQIGDGPVLAEAEISPELLSAARTRAADWLRAEVLIMLALVLLAGTAPLVEWRRHVRARRATLAASAVLVAMVVAARILVWFAVAPFNRSPHAETLSLLPNALLLAAAVWLVADLLERRRTRVPRQPLVPSTGDWHARLAAAYVVSGLLVVLLLWAYERSLQNVAARSSIDLIRFSLHPLEADRLGMASGLILLHASAIWGAGLLLRLPASLWRGTRSATRQGVALVSVVAGAAIALLILRTRSSVPLAPLLTAGVAAGLAAFAIPRVRVRARHASQAARLGGLFLGLLLPAVAMYPALNAFSRAAKERLVAEDYAPLAASQRADLENRQLPQALETIDGMVSLGDLVTSSSEEAAPTTDRAYIVWAQTELARSRTTSAVELYGPNGRLVSRFALNLPEYTETAVRGGNCAGWELYAETSPIAGTARNILRASRAICENRRRVGAVVVRAMLDYRALPFTPASSPYLAALSGNTETSETAAGRDVEFAVYGWSRAPLFSSGPSVWPLPTIVFDRMVAARKPIWAPVPREDGLFRVYFFSDRAGIYALGYPAPTLLGHLINLGELVFLVGVLYVLLLVAATLFNAVTSQTPAGGRALLREIRSSFYRKLFIAFVASAVLPVVVLAFATQRYFAEQFRTRVEEQALRTARVAQRLVEDYAALPRRETSPLAILNDQFMLLVQRAIDQDVNLFDRAQLVATSARDLFASHLLPSRTPGAIYRRVVLDRLPTTVEIEDVGGIPYLLAAAPVRTRGRDNIVAVPQPLRGQEIEEQTDELDRRVISASVLFILFGAAIGYWMAERIADPVNRLTRATRRIARGDLDARIAATSSDELRRLVEDFNQMADDLKRQRANLERTQRLEAWAEMARQVAHDIKNPLTPIQLSAEHARRINLDRGRPLSPVLDDCVTSILSQVKLLRQIAGEFSSFASAPTARPEPTDLPAVIEDALAPYRSGLTGRVAIEVLSDPNLPEAFVDRTVFARALTNIVENALHAMPGGGTLTVTSQAVQSNDRTVVRVEIRDTGVGMDQAALDRIFEPYFSTKATGTGLGLTIAKRNIELLGGTVMVTSARNVGTTVTLEVPAVLTGGVRL